MEYPACCALRQAPRGSRARAACYCWLLLEIRAACAAHAASKEKGSAVYSVPRARVTLLREERASLHLPRPRMVGVRRGHRGAVRAVPPVRAVAQRRVACAYELTRLQHDIMSLLYTRVAAWAQTTKRALPAAGQ